MKKLIIPLLLISSIANADGHHHRESNAWIAPAIIGGAIIGGAIANQYDQPRIIEREVYIERRVQPVYPAYREEPFYDYNCQCYRTIILPEYR